MKPIIGEVVSSTPVSLAEAASILSSFISKGTGATQELSAYLARTRAAFDELVEYHRLVKMRKGASGRAEVIKEEEKHSLKRLKEKVFEGQRLISGDKTTLRAARLDGNGHVEARRDREGMADEKSHKKKRKHREHEVDSGAQEGPARSELVGMPLENGAGYNVKAEDPKERDSRKKKKKRDRQEEGGVSNKSISDMDIEQPPKKKKKDKNVEYEVEVERNVQQH